MEAGGSVTANITCRDSSFTHQVVLERGPIPRAGALWECILPIGMRAHDHGIAALCFGAKDIDPQDRTVAHLDRNVLFKADSFGRVRNDHGGREHVMQTPPGITKVDRAVGKQHDLKISRSAFPISDLLLTDEGWAEFADACRRGRSADIISAS